MSTFAATVFSTATDLLFQISLSTATLQYHRTRPPGMAVAIFVSKTAWGTSLCCFSHHVDCFKVTRVLSWHVTACTSVTEPTPRYNLFRWVIYLPRLFSPPFLSERGLCSAAESYVPSRQKQRATQKVQRARRLVLGRTTGKLEESSGMPPYRPYGREREGRKHGGENATRMNIHHAWATPCTA